MTVTAQTDTDFAFAGIPAIESAPPTTGAPLHADVATAATVDPRGPLALLEGTWKGQGFNTIWRPHHPDSPQDRFLELNETVETLAFTKINGAIPNRGLAMPDINLFGLTYMQQIAEKSNNTGLHIEPGIWVLVPHTSNPNEPQTVARMASIPHGTVLLAQGTAQTVNHGPTIPNNNIIPFSIGGSPSNFATAEATFTELNLSAPTGFRFASPGVNQNMVKNPNSVLQSAIAGQTITSTTILQITTKHAPIKGGGTANTAFLHNATNPPGGNADAVEVDATFWIETVAGTGGHPATHQLQYSQLVQLNFNGLTWPHVTVATLTKQ